MLKPEQAKLGVISVMFETCPDGVFAFIAITCSYSCFSNAVAVYKGVKPPTIITAMLSSCVTIEPVDRSRAPSWLPIQSCEMRRYEARRACLNDLVQPMHRDDRERKLLLGTLRFSAPEALSREGSSFSRNRPIAEAADGRRDRRNRAIGS
jgi:hypothetical protein